MTARLNLEEPGQRFSLKPSRSLGQGLTKTDDEVKDSDDLTTLHYQNIGFASGVMKPKGGIDQDAESEYNLGLQENKFTPNAQKSKNKSYQRPLTAMVECISSQRERSRKKSSVHSSARKDDDDIEQRNKQIEERMESAARRRENKLNQIKMKIKLDHVRKERATVQKIKEVQETLVNEHLSEQGSKSVKKKVIDEEDEPAYTQTSRDHILRHSVSVRPLSALHSK